MLAVTMTPDTITHILQTPDQPHAHTQQCTLINEMTYVYDPQF